MVGHNRIELGAGIGPQFLLSGPDPNKSQSGAANPVIFIRRPAVCRPGIAEPFARRRPILTSAEGLSSLEIGRSHAE